MSHAYNLIGIVCFWLLVLHYSAQPNLSGECLLFGLISASCVSYCLFLVCTGRYPATACRGTLDHPSAECRQFQQILTT